MRPPAAIKNDAVLDLAGPGALLRVTGTATSAADGAVDATWRAWSRALLDAGR
jgi:hypothetical protein